MSDVIGKKCLKLYITAQKYIETDKNKAIHGFMKCIELAEQYVEVNNLELNNIIQLVKKESINYITNYLPPTYLFNVVDHSLHNQLDYCDYGKLNICTYNDDGLTPMHYAISYGDSTFIQKCLLLGCPIDTTCKNGLTLLEHACAEKDPNMIQFFILHGANLQKHLDFRKTKTVLNCGYSIEISLFQKYIYDLYKNNKNNSNKTDLSFLHKYMSNLSIMHTDKSPLQITEFINAFEHLIYLLPSEYKNTYIKIIKEELENYNSSKDIYRCPQCPIDIILYNLYPFVETLCKSPIQLDWLIRNELLFLYSMCKNTDALKQLITTKYINTGLYTTYYMSLMCKIIEHFFL